VCAIFRPVNSEKAAFYRRIASARSLRLSPMPPCEEERIHSAARGRKADVHFPAWNPKKRHGASTARASSGFLGRQIAQVGTILERLARHGGSSFPQIPGDTHVFAFDQYKTGSWVQAPKGVLTICRMFASNPAGIEPSRKPRVGRQVRSSPSLYSRACQNETPCKLGARPDGSRSLHLTLGLNQSLFPGAARRSIHAWVRPRAALP